MEEKFQLEMYRRDNGEVPFRDWLHNLKDVRAVAKIRARLTRMRAGNFGQVRALGDGISELKIDTGPGYRVYFGMAGKTIVLLLLGGDKSTQKRDIQTAKDFWQNYQGE